MRYDVFGSIADYFYEAEIKLDYKEFNKLVLGLMEKDIDFEYREHLGGRQLICDGWDVVINRMSYGHSSGLLEIYGSIVRNEDDEVEGYLTADEILARL